MLTGQKRISAFILSILILSVLSGLACYYGQLKFIEPLYRETFSFSFFLLAFIFIAAVSFVYSLISSASNKKKPLGLFKASILCLLLDFMLYFIITLPTVGFEIKKFLLHLITIGLFCFCIPFTYNQIEKKILIKY